MIWNFNFFFIQYLLFNHYFHNMFSVYTIKHISVQHFCKFFFAGRHTLSGACIETKALDELFPDWSERGVSTEHPFLSDHTGGVG